MRQEFIQEQINVKLIPELTKEKGIAGILISLIFRKKFLKKIILFIYELVQEWEARKAIEEAENPTPVELPKRKKHIPIDEEPGSANSLPAAESYIRKFKVVKID